MAKFIEIKCSGAAPAGGDLLLNAENVNHVAATNGTTVICYLAGGAGSDVATITCAPNANASSTGLRDAIQYALTANPGGVKAKVKLPDGVTISAIAVA